MPSGGIEVIVVTGSYSSSERQIISQNGVRLITLPKTVFVSEAHNVGTLAALGEYVLFLDDDNIVAPDAISHLAVTLQQRQEAVLVGPVMYYGSAPSRIWCAGVSRSRIFMMTRFRTRLPDGPPPRIGSEDFPNCFMVRWKDFIAVDGFDTERFPQHMAEGDFARRLRLSTKGSVYCVTSAKVWHFIGTSLARRLHVQDRHRAYWVGRSRTVFTAMYGTRLQWVVYVALAQWVLFAVYIAAIGVRTRSDRGQLITAYARGIGSGLKHGFAERRSSGSRAPHIEGRKDGPAQ